MGGDTTLAGFTCPQEPTVGGWVEFLKEKRKDLRIRRNLNANFDRKGRDSPPIAQQSPPMQQLDVQRPRRARAAGLGIKCASGADRITRGRAYRARRSPLREYNHRPSLATLVRMALMVLAGHAAAAAGGRGARAPRRHAQSTRHDRPGVSVAARRQRAAQRGNARL